MCENVNENFQIKKQFVNIHIFPNANIVCLYEYHMFYCTCLRETATHVFHMLKNTWKTCFSYIFMCFIPPQKTHEKHMFRANKFTGEKQVNKNHIVSTCLP